MLRKGFVWALFLLLIAGCGEKPESEVDLALKFVKADNQDKQLYCTKRFREQIRKHRHKEYPQVTRPKVIKIERESKQIDVHILDQNTQKRYKVQLTQKGKDWRVAEIFTMN